MATIVLTAVGGLIGGPLGAAIGSFAGQQIDTALLGGAKSREGPRLKELAVTTSSYGSPIARHFGVMRVPGTIIWSTDLIETRQTSGGGKGKPKTTTYSYRASFAVALGSRPITSIGRIWADGSLLRGTAGDLKTAGTMRVHNGHGDQPADPLISSAKGGNVPAFRDIAYVVFEDLELGAFGNRIPALTFEVYSDEQDEVTLALLAPGAKISNSNSTLSEMLGFSDEGGSLLSTLAVIDQVYPLVCVAGSGAPEIQPAYDVPAQLPVLPPALSGHDDNDAQQPDAVELRRVSGERSETRALRYYDRNRDHQPGIQRAVGRKQAGREEVVDLPAAMTATGARTLCSDYAQRRRWQGDQLSWRVAEIDPSIGPGKLVKIPDRPGTWLIRSWEWNDNGIDLALDRTPPASGQIVEGSSGELYPPADLQPVPTHLRAFELPWDGTGSPSSPAMFAAMSAEDPHWSGAALFVEQGSALEPLDILTRSRSVIGSLATPLLPSAAVYLDENGTCEIDLIADDLGLSATSVDRLANGANRMLIGDEVVQFLDATPITATRWRLSGLLRGRGGTEHSALAGHAIGASTVLLDDMLIPLDPSEVASSPSTRLAAIGFGDDEPVYALLVSSGLTRRPLSPVHPRKIVDAYGDWQLCWTRRARGQWRWEDYVETPLVEELEKYLVGIGPIAQPFASWQPSSPSLTIAAATISSLFTAHGAQPVWVRQIGTFGQSPAALIAHLS